MENFQLHIPTRIVFGKETHKQVGELVGSRARRVLFHYGGGSIKRTGLYDQIKSSLVNSGVEVVELGGVVPNPRVTLVRKGVGLCKQENVDFILAVGGGSVIDSAKAIAMGVYHDGDIWDVFAKRQRVEKALPLGTVLTIPATGTEGGGGTVITNEDTKQKLAYSSPHLCPVFSVINPELFFTLPKEQIAYGICDMMSHIFERYFSPTQNVELTDALCEATLRVIMRNGLRLIKDPEDYDAWCQVGFGGTIAHNNLLGVGRIQDWASHGMQHELGAAYDVAHGAGLAVVTPAWMKYVYRDALGVFTGFAVKIMGVDGDFRDLDGVVREGISRLCDFFRKMGLPLTLKELCVPDSDEELELLAKRATGEARGREWPLGGIKKLYWQDVLAIYKLAR